MQTDQKIMTVVKMVFLEDSSAPKDMRNGIRKEMSIKKISQQ